jgi:DNA-binding transcriptional LysR family regulator
LTRVLSYQAARPVREGKLRIVLQEFEPEPLPVSLVHAGADRIPLKIRSFLDFAAPRLRRSLRDI